LLPVFRHYIQNPDDFIFIQLLPEGKAEEADKHAHPHKKCLLL
jgi:hypothetical protein